MEKRLTLCVLLAVVLAAMGADKGRATTKPQAKPTTRPVDDVANKVTVGMTREEAEKVLGKPDDAMVRSDHLMHLHWFVYEYQPIRDRFRKVKVAEVEMVLGEDGKANSVGDNRQP